MSAERSSYAWGLVALVLVALAVPWFLWGSSRVVAGLPVWVWWHIGWMGLTTVVFYVFTRTGWDVGTGSRGGADG
jgi:hypothetical protein